MRALTQLLAFVVLLSVATTMLCSQQPAKRSAMTMGTRYVVAFPRVWPEGDEQPLPVPLTLTISAATKATVHVRSLAARPDVPAIDKWMTVEPHRVTKVKLDPAYVSADPSKITGNAIEITSDVPVSVTTLQAWLGNGEQTLHLPVFAWGTEYFSHNFYQDRFGPVHDRQYRPSQILIIAQDDSTIVSYVPTLRTQSGPDAPSTPAGATQRVTLQRGQTFLIQDSIVMEDVRTWRTDLSGTRITATKPIAVISGHTKVAIMRMPDELPPAAIVKIPATMVRNNVHETMLPTSYAGTRFITIPAMYTPQRTPVGAMPQYGVDNDSGDVIRVMATVDRTIVRRKRADIDDTYATVDTLNAGESYLDTVSIVPTEWITTAPALVSQYMKSWAKILASRTPLQPDETTGWIAVEAGLPSQCMVPPLDRGISYGTWWSVEGMDSFLSIVFKQGSEARIKMDGVSLGSSLYAGLIRQIAGTEYSYMRVATSAGDHRLEAEADSIRWIAWNYASLDGLQSGRSSSTTVGLDLAIPCSDTMRLTSAAACGDVQGMVELDMGDLSCGRMGDVGFHDVVNYTVSFDTATMSNIRSRSFHLTIIDRSKAASARLRAVALSGSFVDTTFRYVPDTVVTNDDGVGLYWRTTDTSVCRTITVRNPSTRPVQVTGMGTRQGLTVVSFVPSTFTLAPGATQQIRICARIERPATFMDSIIVRTTCRDIALLPLQIGRGGPVIDVSDASWSYTPPDQIGTSRSVLIRNIGQTDLTITGYDRALLGCDTCHFREVSGDTLSLPLSIQPDGFHVWRIVYEPSGDVGEHSVDVTFYSDNAIGDAIAELRGRSIPVGVEDAEASITALQVWPNPARSTIVVGGAPQEALCTIFDMHGRPLHVTSTGTIDVSSLPPGPYVLRVMSGGEGHTRLFHVVR